MVDARGKKDGLAPSGGRVPHNRSASGAGAEWAARAFCWLAVIEKLDPEKLAVAENEAPPDLAADVAVKMHPLQLADPAE